MSDLVPSTPSYPSDLSIEDIKVRILQTSGNPNIGKTHQVVLKDGPRAFRVATIFEILDPAKGNLHHLSLQLDSYDRTKAGWRAKPDKKIRLEGRDPNEIKILSKFLESALSETYPDQSGEFHIVPESQFRLVSALSESLPKLAGSEKVNLVRLILESLDAIDTNSSDFLDAFKDTAPEIVRNIGFAARFVDYKAAYEEFRKLVEKDGVTEREIQSHLQQYPWLFGSEYSELLDRRTWTRDNSLDFMLRRAADGYLEIVEIKTPFKDSLMRHDASHDSFYASSKLSQAIGQVLLYIEEVERNRDSIIASDRLDPFKIRAKIIIGRDHAEPEQLALRSYNSHLNRVEVLTFDQLLRIGKRTIDIFEAVVSEAQQTSDDEFRDDIPF